jgi:hypothetical protein
MGDGRPVRRSPPGATWDASRVVRRPVFARPWWLLPVGRLPPLWWVLIAAFLLAVDIVTGPKTQFPVVYAIPVILAAWYSGRWPGLALAVGIPSIHLVLLLALWNDAGSTATLLATTAIRMAVVSTSVRLTATSTHWKDSSLCARSARVFGTSQANGRVWKPSSPSDRMPSSRTRFAPLAGGHTTRSWAILPTDRRRRLQCLPPAVLKQRVTDRGCR